jgi:hypothetical protein
MVLTVEKSENEFLPDDPAMGRGDISEQQKDVHSLDYVRKCFEQALR